MYLNTVGSIVAYPLAIYDSGDVPVPEETYEGGAYDNFGQDTYGDGEDVSLGAKSLVFRVLGSPPAGTERSYPCAFSCTTTLPFRALPLRPERTLLGH